MNKLHTFGAVCAFFEPDIVDLELGKGNYIYYNITGRASNGIKDVDNSGVEDKYMDDRSYEDSDFKFTVDDLMDFVVTDIVYERFESVNKIRVDITIPVKDPNELERLIKEKHEKEKKLSDTLSDYKKRFWEVMAKMKNNIYEKMRATNSLLPSIDFDKWLESIEKFCELENDSENADSECKNGEEKCDSSVKTVCKNSENDVKIKCEDSALNLIDTTGAQDTPVTVYDSAYVNKLLREIKEKDIEIERLRGCSCGNSSETNCCGCCGDDICKEDIVSLDKLVKPLEFTAELPDNFYENLKKVSDPVQNRHFSVKLEKQVEGTGDEECDNVNHPRHYASASNGIECIDAIEAATERLLGLEAVCTGNVLKYIWRWKDKNGVEDLQKAKWYLEKLIEEVSDCEEKE